MPLIKIKVDLNNFSLKVLEGNFIKIKDNYKNIIKIFGKPSEIKYIQEKINSLKNKANIFSNIEKISNGSSGLFTVVIYNDQNIKICTSVYHPTLRIFKSKNEYIITENEFLSNGTISKTSAYVKLFSHHSYFFHAGISDEAIDFLTPASSLIFKKNSKNYSSDWYLNFENFCTNTSNENDAVDIAKNMVEVMSGYKNQNNYLSLSGGVDSALTLAASIKAGINIQNVHLSDPTYDDETSTAKNVSSYFKKKIKIYYNYTGSKFKIFSRNTNIFNLLETTFDEMKGDSVKFPLCNSLINLKYNLNGHNGYIHDGNSFPTTLTVRHWFKYPNRKNKNFDFNQNSKLRYYDSKLFFDKQLSQVDFSDKWGLKEKFPTINKYYWPLLDCFYTGNNFHSDHPKNNINNYFPLFDLIKDKKRMNETLKKRGDAIIIKIIQSNFFKNKLYEKNSLTAQILLKFIVFINESCKIMHQNFAYSSENLIINTPGLNGSLLLKLLSISIDEKLINNAKWHIFKSFENLSEIKFENLFMYESLLNPKFLIKRSYQKIFCNVNGLIEFNQVYTFLNNKFFKEFIREKQIFNKYKNLKNHLENSELPAFPNDNDLANPKKISENWWLLNNIINLTSKL